MLCSLRAHLEGAIGNPNHFADTGIISDLRALINSMVNNDHFNTTEPHRFIINYKFEHHIELVLEELRLIA